MRGIKRWILGATALAMVLGLGMPAHAQKIIPDIQKWAYGEGTDGVGNRLVVLAGDNFIVGGGGIAFVRLANQSGAAALVVFSCLIIDDRPGFDFMYASGKGTDGRNFFIGVFDNTGPNRTGPYDVIYTQTTAVNGPCGVAAGSSYPIGWFPVSSGEFTVGPN